MSAFKNDPQLVATENAVPTHMRSLASALRRIVSKEFLNARKAVPWHNRIAGDGAAVRLRPSCKSHAPTGRGISSMERRQRNRGIEPLHRLHQIKGRADHIGRRAGSDQAGMRNVGTGEGAEHPRLTMVGGIAVATRTARRSPQNIAATVAFEPQQNILGAARQGRGILNRASSKVTIVHPRAQLAEIDEIPPGVPAHASLPIGRVHDATLGPYSSTARSRACCVW